MKRTKKVRLPNTQPAGKSKYALKVERRKALAKKLGVTPAPLPVLNGTILVETADDDMPIG